MPTPPVSSSGPDRAASRPWRRLFRWGRRGAVVPSEGQVRSPRVADSRVDYVIDPDGAVFLFRIMGPASMRTVDELDRLTARLDARHHVHLDLFDATIPSVGVVRGLEMLADRLERAMVHVRMVGVDPNHPALDTNT